MVLRSIKTDEKKKCVRKLKTVRVSMNVWHNNETGHIHIASPGKDGFISWVSNDRKSKRRYHPNLYGKLREILKGKGRW